MKFQENILLAPYTTFKIGGPAEFFCEAESEEKILEALEFAQEKNLPVFVLGGGSNLLVADKGFDGVVIRIQNSKFKIQNSSVECGAGCHLSKIVNESIKFGLTGMEWAAGIPGTVGGAVRGNAGAYGGTMGDLVESVKVLEFPTDQGSTFPLSAFASNSSRSNFSSRDCKFDYRGSIFKQNRNLIILSVKLKLKEGNREESEKRVREILAMRKEKQPMEFPSAGSFFKNPHLHQGFGEQVGGQAETKIKELANQFERDTNLKIKDDKIPAAYLIEEAGLKGKKIGGAMVSEKHANFIVNTGDATAEDVITLAAVIKSKVRNKFGIQLQEEVQYVGF